MQRGVEGAVDREGLGWPCSIMWVLFAAMHLHGVVEVVCKVILERNKWIR